jgi:magnesium transporter
MIINCVAYENGRKLADISADDISTYIARPNCFVWVALKEPHPAELQAMQHEFGLHELALEDARHGHQRPKIDEYNGSLFVVLHLIELNNDDLNVGEVAIFAGPKYVLSVRSRAERGLADVRALRTGARPFAPRCRLRSLCADGCRGGSLFSSAR